MKKYSNFTVFLFITNMIIFFFGGIMCNIGLNLFYVVLMLLSVLEAMDIEMRRKRHERL